MRILKGWPTVKVVAVDFSKPMNDVFRRSFRREFPSVDIDSRVRFVEEDILGEDGQPAALFNVVSDFTNGQKKSFDAVISALTLHHLERSEKLEAYDRAFKVLKSGGHFINGDLFSYESQLLTDSAKEFDMTWIRNHFKERSEELKAGTVPPGKAPINGADCERLSALWLRHYEEDNILDSAEIQEQMLKFCGFRHTGVPFRYWQAGILWARK